jgi:pimeloyl-ACP methyl ester carboxylesterase
MLIIFSQTYANRVIFGTMIFLGLLLCASKEGPAKEEISFDSGPFHIVGDLQLPEGRGPFPVILFVHGDGPNSRTSAYPPIMERMLKAGHATFAWDKPGTGASTGTIDRHQLFEQRTQIVLDAIERVKNHPDIDSKSVGMWGISQAGYIMPLVLTKTDDVRFMIAISCPGCAGVGQGAYLLSRQAVCSGLPEEQAKEVEALFLASEQARTYEEYAAVKRELENYPELKQLEAQGVRLTARPKEEWEPNDPSGHYFWDPMQVIEQTTIPILAVFGGKDTQVDPVQGKEAYESALQKAGNTDYRVELIQGTDHNILITETGCITERMNYSREGWFNYPAEYLGLIEEWLGELEY